MHLPKKSVDLRQGDPPMITLGPMTLNVSIPVPPSNDLGTDSQSAGRL